VGRVCGPRVALASIGPRLRLANLANIKALNPRGKARRSKVARRSFRGRHNGQVERRGFTRVGWRQLTLLVPTRALRSSAPHMRLGNKAAEPLPSPRNAAHFDETMITNIPAYQLHVVMEFHECSSQQCVRRH